jgi:hypothetical protein
MPSDPETWQLTQQPDCPWVGGTLAPQLPGVWVTPPEAGLSRNCIVINKDLMEDAGRSSRFKQYRACLLILAPLFLAFSVVGIADGDVGEGIIWALADICAICWLLSHRSPRPTHHAPVGRPVSVDTIQEN